MSSTVNNGRVSLEIEVEREVATAGAPSLGDYPGTPEAFIDLRASRTSPAIRKRSIKESLLFIFYFYFLFFFVLWI